MSVRGVRIPLDRFSVTAERDSRLAPDPMLLPRLRLAAALILASAALGAARADTPNPVVWTFRDLHAVGGAVPEILGAPQVQADGAVHFNGVDQGLIVPANPISGWSQFTVAILFRPEDNAPEAQRFFHIEDPTGRRLTIEDRVVKGKGWYMDTFLLDGKGKALIDPAKLHPLGQWAWGELVYDGKTMRSYVNGVAELNAEVAFAPMAGGHTSVGVRLNKVYWFQGEIREVRFYPAALAPADLPTAP